TLDILTNMSVNSFTGVASSSALSPHNRRIFAHCSGGHRDAKLLSNFFARSGIPSARRRRWPIGYSTAIFAVLDPSVKKTCTAFAIERFSRAREYFDDSA